MTEIKPEPNEDAKAAFLKRAEDAEAKAAKAPEVEDDDTEAEPADEEVVEVEAAEDDVEDDDEPTDPVWDKAIDAAFDAGLTEEDIKGFDSPAALSHAATLLAKRSSKSGDETVSDDNSADDQEGDEIDWDYLDPDVKTALKAIQSSHAREVADLRRRLDEFAGSVKEQAKAASDARFTTYVEKLEKPHQKLFESASNRTKVRDEMDVLRDGYRSRDRKVPSEDELFSKALHSVFSSELKKIDADRVKRSVKARQSQMTIPPSARRAAQDGNISIEDQAKEMMVDRFERMKAS